MPSPANHEKNTFSAQEQDLLQQVYKVFENFLDPVTGTTLQKSGLVEGLILKNGKLSFALKIPAARISEYEALSEKLKIALQEIPGLQDILIVLTAHNKETPAIHKKPMEKLIFPTIRKIIAIASGKGGVGKSTLAVNIALQLKEAGLTVGLLDADLYGPSLPSMLGLQGRPELTDEKKIIPLEYHGLKCVSIGFMIQETTPVIWRGPVIQSSFLQLIKETCWGSLDVLVIDLPPGTGDTHLTLVQKIPLAGVVIVSTPQDIALIDARRAIAMFHKLEIPVLGMVENMSVFKCPHCQHETPIFHHGGARRESQIQGIPFLGEIPLQITIRESLDEGNPIRLQHDHTIAPYFRHIAAQLKQSLFK